MRALILLQYRCRFCNKRLFDYNIKEGVIEIMCTNKHCKKINIIDFELK